MRIEAELHVHCTVLFTKVVLVFHTYYNRWRCAALAVINNNIFLRQPRVFPPADSCCCGCVASVTKNVHSHERSRVELTHEHRQQHTTHTSDILQHSIYEDQLIDYHYIYQWDKAGGDGEISTRSRDTGEMLVRNSNNGTYPHQWKWKWK